MYIKLQRQRVGLVCVCDLECNYLQHSDECHSELAHPENPRGVLFHEIIWTFLADFVRTRRDSHMHLGHSSSRAIS